MKMAQFLYFSEDFFTSFWFVTNYLIAGCDAEEIAIKRAPFI